MQVQDSSLPLWLSQRNGEIKDRDDAQNARVLKLPVNACCANAKSCMRRYSRLKLSVDSCSCNVDSDISEEVAV